MTDLVFVDTNVLVYFHDATEPDKQAPAARWLEALWRRRTGRISYQVLQEFYVTVTAKLDPGLAAETARESVQALEAWKPVAVGGPILARAWSVQDRYSLSWWDALIVSAAQSAGCSALLTEDLQHGQDLDGLTVISPFRSEPAE